MSTHNSPYMDVSQGDVEQDLSSNGILGSTRSENDVYEPRQAFDLDCRSPSPPPLKEGQSRFFLAQSDTEASSTFSPVTPDISISYADEDASDHSGSSSSAHESIMPSELQERGQTGGFDSAERDVRGALRHYNSFGTLGDIYSSYGAQSPYFSPQAFSPPTSPSLSTGIASRRPGLSQPYMNPYLPNINSVNFQNSQNALLEMPETPGSPALASPRPFPAHMHHFGNTAITREPLASPPHRSLKNSLSVPVLRGSPRLHHSSSGSSRAGPSSPRKHVLRRQRSTALDDYDDETKEIDNKKRKPRYYDPHNSSIPKPWLQHKDRKELWSRLLTYGGMLVGILCSALLCFSGATSVKYVGNVCLVLDEEFSSSTLNNKVWAHEVNMGGFGNGEFEMTTSSSNNSYIEDGILYIVPTLTSEMIGNGSVFNGYTYNLTGCTDVNVTACSAISNSTTKSVINPVQSARLTTLVNGSTTSIQYGRIEVRARMPKGDWLWPAIWMLPVNNTYGPWPMSGEIDIVESRGNNASYPKQGINYVRSSLNWGPNTFINSVWKTYGWYTERRKNFNDDFHTYTLEWTSDFLRTYVDSRLHFTLNLKFSKESFFERGQYPNSALNGTEEVTITNPWEGRGNNAPFDQPFYLIMNVAVGGTNGWFPDGAGGKPWLDGSSSAMHDFAKAQDQWYPTWPTDPKQRGMAIDSVKMWKQC